MKKSELRIPDYLEHILESINRIRQYTKDLSEADFRANQLIQDGVIRNVEIIGEASKNIEAGNPDFVANHPELPLKEIYAMRNQLAHGYFTVDTSLGWKTIQRDIP